MKRLREISALSLVIVLVVYVAPVGRARPYLCFGREATIVGTPKEDRIIGTRASDVIVALAGNDLVSGGGGRDFICTGPGGTHNNAESVDGGFGFDYISTGRGQDYVRGMKGRDVIRAGGGRAIVYGGADGDVLRGGGGRDFIHGQTGHDRLKGEGGSDSLEGNSGNDTIIGGSDGGWGDMIDHKSDGPAVTVNLGKGVAIAEGTDTLRGMEGAWGTYSDDLLIGNHKDNFFSAYNGDDVLRGRGGHDCLDPGSHNNQVYGGKGLDLHTEEPNLALIGKLGCYLSTYAGGFEPPGFEGGVTVDLVAGTAERQFQYSKLYSIEGAMGTTRADRLIGDAGANYFFGDGSNDDIDGGEGGDRLAGGGGDDDVAGGAGRDLLNGNGGADQLDGGDDDDECRNGEIVLNCET
ncbi:MAG: hypothetical protein M3285_08525 [Actinomycetota bacterium]|nr:hypothetical protein [Actinomycetota bacterium]